MSGVACLLRTHEEEEEVRKENKAADPRFSFDKDASPPSCFHRRSLGYFFPTSRQTVRKVAGLPHWPPSDVSESRNRWRRRGDFLRCHLDEREVEDLRIEITSGPFWFSHEL